MVVSVVILQDLHNVIFFLFFFLPLEYVGVFSKCKESTVTLTYITNLLDILGDGERRNHAGFLLKYIAPWFLGFLQKYWNLCGKAEPDLIVITGLEFKICILRIFLAVLFLQACEWHQKRKWHCILSSWDVFCVLSWIYLAVSLPSCWFWKTFSVWGNWIMAVWRLGYKELADSNFWRDWNCAYWLWQDICREWHFP